MAALNLLSRRWVLRIIWELRKEPRGFREMRVLRDGMSPNTLSTRLGELKEAGIVAHDQDGNCALTPLGRKLGPALRALAKGSDEWADAVERGDVGRAPYAELARQRQRVLCAARGRDLGHRILGLRQASGGAVRRVLHPLRSGGCNAWTSDSSHLWLRP